MADLRDRARRTRLAPHFEAPMLRQVIRRTTFHQDDIADAILMGPNARHLLQVMQVPRSMKVTIDVEFLFARRQWI